MFCESCGNQLPDNAKFCTACGAKTDRVQTASAQPAYTPPPQAQPAYTPAPAQPAYNPPPQAQPVYNSAPAQPVYSAGATMAAPLGVGQYIGMFLLMGVPILNLILLFKWAFGSSANLNKKNFARASLILAAIALIFWILTGGIIIQMFSSIFEEMIGYY